MFFECSALTTDFAVVKAQTICRRFWTTWLQKDCLDGWICFCWDPSPFVRNIGENMFGSLFKHQTSKSKKMGWVLDDNAFFKHNNAQWLRLLGLVSLHEQTCKSCVAIISTCWLLCHHMKFPEVHLQRFSMDFSDVWYSNFLILVSIIVLQENSHVGSYWGTPALSHTVREDQQKTYQNEHHLCKIISSQPSPAWQLRSSSTIEMDVSSDQSFCSFALSGDFIKQDPVMNQSVNALEGGPTCIEDGHNP